jgi:hypothetical protein
VHPVLARHCQGHADMFELRALDSAERRPYNFHQEPTSQLQQVGQAELTVTPSMARTTRVAL